MRIATAISDELKKANMRDISLDPSVNKATSCWWILGKKTPKLSQLENCSRSTFPAP